MLQNVSAVLKKKKKMKQYNFPKDMWLWRLE